MGVSRRRYASMRGVSDMAVRKAIASGRISVEADGTIDPAKADAEWERQTDPSKQRGVHAQALGTRTAAGTARAAATKPVPKAAIDAVNATLGDSGDTSSGSGGEVSFLRARMESSRLPADRVAHLFERQRVQSRGVPWGAPAMRAIRDVADWQQAELVRKRTEACLVGIVFGADEDQQSIAPVVEDASGNRIEQFEPGLIAYARGGKDIKFNQPASTAGVYEWHRVQLHIIAAGFRVPYALMTGDLSQTSFSSSRVGLNEFRRMVEQLQWQTVIPMFCEPIWRWFVDAAVMAGLLPEGVEIPAEWGPPKFESVNPLQDAQADLLEVRAGFSTLPQQIARRGYDPDEVLAEWAGFAKKSDAAGLVFDSDPRRATKGGLVQTTDPTSPPTSEEK